MAFDPSNVSLAVDSIAGGSLRIFFYTTADSEDTVTGDWYFSGLEQRGSRVGDIIMVHTTSPGPAGELYILKIDSTNADGDASAVIPTYATQTSIETVAGTTRALTQDDHMKFLEFTNASNVTITVPSGIVPPFTVGLSQGGAGQLTVDPDPGVTLNEPDGQFSSAGQYELLTLFCVAADTFRLYGKTG